MKIELYAWKNEIKEELNTTEEPENLKLINNLY
jgi:hypothetical protein